MAHDNFLFEDLLLVPSDFSHDSLYGLWLSG